MSVECQVSRIAFDQRYRRLSSKDTYRFTWGSKPANDILVFSSIMISIVSMHSALTLAAPKRATAANARDFVMVALQKRSVVLSKDFMSMHVREVLSSKTMRRTERWKILLCLPATNRKLIWISLKVKTGAMGSKSMPKIPV